MKLAVVSAMSPDLKGRCDYTGRGRASNAKAAISRAFADWYKQVGRRRVTTIRAVITVVVIEETSGDGERINVPKRD
jgi:hypothetical protein